MWEGRRWTAGWSGRLLDAFEEEDEDDVRSSVYRGGGESGTMKQRAERNERKGGK